MTLLEHIEIARSIMTDHGSWVNDIHSMESAMDVMRALAGFIIAIHPELASADHDDRIDSLVEVINCEITDAEFMERLFMEALNDRAHR
jgi:hypothetical protein